MTTTNPAPPLAQYHDRVIALAGAFQALALVQQVAHTGQIDTLPFLISMRSVVNSDAPSTEAVYGGRAHLQLGLQTFVQHLDGQTPRDVELARYWLGILALERKLAKKPPLLSCISEGLTPLAHRVELDGAADEAVVSDVASLYKDTVSTLTPRIMVSGEPKQLNTEATANRIRALLLAAIRATVLWRQAGGTRLGMMFSRRQLSGAARELLDSINASEL